MIQRFSWIALILLIALASLPVSTLAQSQPPAPTPTPIPSPIAPAPSQGPAILESGIDGLITLTASAERFALSLRIVPGNAQSLRIGVGPLMRADGIISTPATIALGDGVQTTAELTPNGRNRLTVVLVGQLPERTVYSGELTLSAGSRIDVYTLRLTRASPAKLSVAEAAGGVLALQVGAGHFERTISLQAPADQSAVDDVTIALDPLRRQDEQPAQSATLTTTLTQLRLESGDVRHLTLIGADLEATSYASNLRLTYQGQELIIPITITRAPLTNLTVDDPGTASGWRWFWFTAPGTLDAFGDIRIIIHETQGQPAAIYAPQLGPLRQDGAQGEILSPSGYRVDAVPVDSSGAELRPTSSLRPNSTAAAAVPSPASLAPALRSSAQPTMAVIGPNGGTTYLYRVRNLSPGRYQGQVMISGPNMASVTKAFTIVVKDSPLLAFLIILAGVLGSYWLRSWTQSGRGRALRSIRFASEQAQVERILAAHPPADDARIWQQLFAELGSLRASVGFGGTGEAEAAAALERIRSRRAAFQDALSGASRIRELLAQVGGQQKTSGWRAEREQQIGELMVVVRTTVQQEDAQASESTKALLGRIDTLYRGIFADAIMNQAEALKQQLSAQNVEGVQLPSTAQELAERLMDDLNLLLSNAQTTDVRVLASLATEFRPLRDRGVDVLTRQLAALIEHLRAEEPDPALPYWESIAERLERAELSLGAAGAADDRMAVLNEGWYHYTMALIERLTAQSGPDSQPIERRPDWEAARATVPDLDNLVAQARRAKTYAEARLAYQRAQDAYLTVLTAVLRQRYAAIQSLFDRTPLNRDLQARAGDETKSCTDAAAKLEAAQHLIDALEHGGGEAAARQSAYHAARLALAQAQVKAVAALSAPLKRTLEPIFMSSPGEVTERLKMELQSIETAENKARDWLTAAEMNGAAADSPALENAEAEGYQAEVAYRTLIDTFDRPVSKAVLSPDEQQADGAAQNAAAISSAIAPLAGGLTGDLPGLPAWADTPNYSPLVFGGVTDQMTEPQLLDYIRRRDIYTAVAFAGLATLSGLAALWIANPIFGSLSDYITAFLWGFGVHQITASVAGSTASPTVDNH